MDVIVLGDKEIRPRPRALSLVTQDSMTRKPIVRSSRDGLLICSSHDSAWCYHIEAVIKQMADSDSIFGDYYDADVENLLVPILPVGYSIYANIMLIPISERMFKVELWKGPPSLDDGVPLGTISIGDGRLQLRQMILEWMLPQLEMVLPKCTSIQHNWRREAEVSGDLKSGDKKDIIAHHWCILWYKKCARCMIDEGEDAEFYPDLVPES